ncbi:protein translocase subunit SecD [Synechococcus sp. RS9916]|uniref:protein translocase subunit SecD n=1 Tax=Synechococcus sp. RS9916 TaxID=221359 RepID=UPI0000E53EDE|nr:protein translocase subunit SecD [Synechococcus sp. RS9916]EAU73624.1 preprotein translocase subunit [Synechococcus sp. RS9916]
MARQQGWFALILSLAITSALWLFVISPGVDLGLDLRGGSQLLLEVQPAGSITKITKTELESVKSVLDRRVNSLGVAESTLQTVGDDQLVLQLPGETDPSKAAEKLGKTALLEFRAQKPGISEEMRGLQRLRSQVKSILAAKEARGDSDETSIDPEAFAEAQKALGLEGSAGSEQEQLEQVLAKADRQFADGFEPAAFNGKLLTRAGTRGPTEQSPGWAVTLSFNSEGGDKFAELTKSIAGTDRLLGIFLDGSPISEASVGSQFKVAGITGGNAEITGRFSAEEANDLAELINGGALPLPVEILQVRTIGPSLGAENVQRSLVAALSGLALVTVFMVLIYRLAGAVAVVALALYALFNLSVYSLIGVTLTLPGIAGFILSIGMAVDANVLIFERIKDELRSGNTLVRSIETAFSQAFSSIIDGHLTTLISCAALFTLGTGLVKGFAATLGIGVVLSLFTALTCTRTLLRFLMGYQGLRRPTNFLPQRQLPTQSA